MENKPFLNTLFNLIEHVTKSELQNTSKHLIYNYLLEAEGAEYAEKARNVIKRYTAEEIPTLAEIRSKSNREKLSKLDHLVLKMEYEARKIRG